MAKLNVSRKKKMNESVTAAVDKIDGKSPKMTPLSVKKGKQTPIRASGGMANGKKRQAEDEIDEKVSPKKVKITFDCDDELLKSQYERFYKIEAGDWAMNLNRLRLVVHRTPREATLDMLKEAFPKSVKIDRTKNIAFVGFLSEGDAKEAFDDSLNLAICGRKVNVLFDHFKPPRDRREEKKINKQKPKNNSKAVKRTQIKKEIEEDVGESESEDDVGESEIEEDVVETKIGKIVGQKKMGKTVGQKKMGKAVGQKKIGKTVGQIKIEKTVGQKKTGKAVGQIKAKKALGKMKKVVKQE